VNAINAGMPLDRGSKSELPTAFDGWADRLMGTEESASAAAGGGSKKLFGLFGS